LDAESLNKLGTFDAPAANEPGEVVVGTIFTYTRTVTADEPHAAAEIGDTAWVVLLQSSGGRKTCVK
ncbi:MAG: hypothetical protein E7J80_11770, partial [Corynebacterium sp.]|nr:hypothetical protein [Corynebacterium sp.]